MAPLQGGRARRARRDDRDRGRRRRPERDDHDRPGGRPLRPRAAAPAARPRRPRRPSSRTACSSRAPKEELTDAARARLEALVDTTDGFELAEVDLELRGEGRAARHAPVGPLRPPLHAAPHRSRAARAGAAATPRRCSTTTGRSNDAVDRVFAAGKQTGSRRRPPRGTPPWGRTGTHPAHLWGQSPGRVLGSHGACGLTARNARSSQAVRAPAPRPRDRARRPRRPRRLRRLELPGPGDGDRPDRHGLERRVDLPAGGQAEGRRRLLPRPGRPNRGDARQPPALDRPPRTARQPGDLPALRGRATSPTRSRSWSRA